jgi:hypothetical protein
MTEMGSGMSGFLPFVLVQSENAAWTLLPLVASSHRRSIEDHGCHIRAGARVRKSDPSMFHAVRAHVRFRSRTWSEYPGPAST